jgi:hypothetical protein
MEYFLLQQYRKHERMPEKYNRISTIGTFFSLLVRLMNLIGLKGSDGGLLS